MQIVIDLLENQIKLSENRLKTHHYPIAIEPSVRSKILACKDAIKVLDSERWKRINASDKNEPKALIIDDVSSSLSMAKTLLKSIISADTNVIDDYESSDVVIRDLYHQCKALIITIGNDC